MCIIFFCVLAGSKADESDVKPPAGVLFDRDVVYGKGSEVELKLDIARPEFANNARPCVVLIHGGAWRAGNKAELDNFAIEFAKREYVAATLGYRFCPQHVFPAQVEDVKCAIRFLRANAKKYGIDPERIGAMGFSAGAHLAMMLGVMDKTDGLEGNGGWADQSSKVQAVVSYAGPVDLLAEYPDVSKGLVRDFIGGLPDKFSHAYKAASPVTYVNRGDAPMLLFQGTEDELVPYKQVYRMIDALSAAGVPGHVEILLGEKHGFTGTEVIRTLLESYAFFEAQFRVPRNTN
ncbi:MAG: hypothetical protein A2283_20765 [Lentisphaerae bacterium RIFOXYA12_FULL_48_11]|nr:MAG: hypothetical protein A2283_20765 [Lentisphaerae bacterium RIFOXYA12_FULL_48_11]